MILPSWRCSVHPPGCCCPLLLFHTQMIHRFTNRFPPWPLHFPGEEEEEKWVGRHELHHQKEEEGKNKNCATIAGRLASAVTMGSGPTAWKQKHRHQDLCLGHQLTLALLFIPSTKEFILIGVATSAGKEKDIRLLGNNNSNNSNNDNTSWKKIIITVVKGKPEGGKELAE